MIEMPALASAQEAAWHALLDLYSRQSEGWTLIGGQLVHLLCAERGYRPHGRPTMPTPWWMLDGRNSSAQSRTT